MDAERVYYQQNYNRRGWLQLCSLALAGIYMPGAAMAGTEKKLPYQYYKAKVKVVPFTMPAGKTIPFDWPVAEAAPEGSPVIMNWDKQIKGKNKDIRFRLTSATDVREYCVLEVLLAVTKEVVGTINISYAHYMQPFELSVSYSQLQKIMKEGIVLKMIKGAKPFWFFMMHQNDNEIPDAYLPHILVSQDLAGDAAWKERLLSLACLSTFGWMEGCVLDGINMMAENDIHAKKILQQHLDKYFSNNTLVYQNLNNERSAEKINTVESILPFAILALHHPQHAMLQRAIDFCISHAGLNGVIADEQGNNRRLKTEECYTISYPLAMLGVQLNRPELTAMSIINLEARVKLLRNNDFIYQNAKELEKPEFGNWARGVAWYLLGLAKSLAVLPNNTSTQILRTALQQGAALAMRYQMPNGLWNCFLHEPETGIETSGSAAIAAALAFGHAENLLPSSCKGAAEKCLAGLEKYYTPDGFLNGTSQVNKGGAALQRNGFRVLSPYTLGFTGIIETSLGRK